MAKKTPPIGVRFSLDILGQFPDKSPHQVLAFLEDFYRKCTWNGPHVELKLNTEIKGEATIDVEDMPPETKGDFAALFGKFVEENPDSAAVLAQKIEALEHEIAQIKMEKIPPERNNTEMGRKSWKRDQQNRIAERERQIKQLQELNNKNT